MAVPAVDRADGAAGSTPTATAFGSSSRTASRSRARRVVVAAGIARLRPPPGRVRRTVRPTSSRTRSSTTTSAASPAGGSSSSAAGRARSSPRRCCTRSGAEVEVLVRDPRRALADAALAAPDAGRFERCCTRRPTSGPAGVSHLVARPASLRRHAPRAPGPAQPALDPRRRGRVARPATARRPHPDRRRDRRRRQRPTVTSGSDWTTGRSESSTMSCSARATASTSRATRFLLPRRGRAGDARRRTTPC